MRTPAQTFVREPTLGAGKTNFPHQDRAIECCLKNAGDVGHADPLDSSISVVLRAVCCLISAMSPDDIANCALHHYESNLTKGRPKSEGEWTVYAAVVAQQEDVLWVLSSATGTKCTTIRTNGCVLHDCHAEVLTRRGLIRVLCRELQKGDQSSLLERHSTGKFRLRSDIALHLYVSCSPCGDASIYPLSKDRVLYTGAKIVVPTDGGTNASELGGGNQQVLAGTNVAREKVQVLGKVRTKSGRSNLPSMLRSSSMCCSDKLVCWQVIGMQGAILSRVMEEVRLSTIVVSRDTRVPTGSAAQAKALDRAIAERVRSIRNEIPGIAVQPIVPSVHTVSSAFPFDKALVECKGIAALGGREHDETEPRAVGTKRKREWCGGSVSACGLSVNWQNCDPDTVELVVGARGVRQGRKPKSDLDYEGLASRLSRRGLLRLFEEVGVGYDGVPQSYTQIKRELSDSGWQEMKTKVLTEGILSGWLRNQVKGDFLWRSSATR
jgi:Adenosine-deaminase (editase) domain